ncbi:MAG: Crp/Fnr family transcriptional regulator [bacterium]|nr:Crp/Fnr family transcriptional regulator [bacterium]
MRKETTLQMVYRHPLFTKEQFQIISESHKEVRFKKGNFFLTKGEIANSFLLLEEGLMRSFLYSYDGNEITTDFYSDQEVVINVLPLFKRIPSDEYIQALTDCVCWQIDLDRFQQLYHSMPGMSEWGRAWMSEQLFQSKQRAVEMITENATTRYLKLIKEKPQVIRQAPLKQIASYLGVTDTSLSRIRKELSKGSFLATR